MPPQWLPSATEQLLVSTANLPGCRPNLVSDNLAITSITDTKSDYALCLDPGDGSPLAGLLRAYRQAGEENTTSHIQLGDESDTPPVVGIETKSGSDAGDPSTQSGAQGASFVRAQHRHLARLPSAAARPLPRLPIVQVLGPQWFVAFAQRTESETIIYERLEIGSSDSIHGCYVICRALSLIARWCVEEYGEWLEAALSPPAGEQLE